MNTDEIFDELRVIVAEPSPERFDYLIDELVDRIMEDDPDSPDFFTVKNQVMDLVSTMFKTPPEV